MMLASSLDVLLPVILFTFQKQLDRVPAPESEGIEMEQEDAWMDRAVIFDKVYKKWEKMTESAVSNASFIAYYGQVTVLLGHDGSGKSTMMQLITGDTEATSGWIFALNLIKGRAHRFRGKSVAYCPQRMPLFGKLTVRDHLRLFYCLKTRDNDWNVDVMSMAAVVGLEDSLDKKPSSLDETSKRLLALATTLVGDTRIILLDEPFEGLDLEGREAYRRVLDSQKENRCILIATSSSDTAEMVADRIIALSGGRVLAAGSLSFLKSTFGFTYVLDVLFAEDVSDKRRPAERLKKVVKRVISNAEIIQMCGRVIRMGLNCAVNEQIQLTRALEQHKKRIGFSQISAALCTMNDIYNRIGNFYVTEEQEQQDDIQMEVDKGDSAIDRRFAFLLIKRCYLIPSCYGLVTAAIPVLLVLLSVITIKFIGSEEDMCKFTLVSIASLFYSSVSYDMYEHGRFVIFDPSNQSYKYKHYFHPFLEWTRLELHWVNSDNFCEAWPSDWPFAVGAVAFGEDIKSAEFVSHLRAKRSCSSPSYNFVINPYL
ncbi:hypothetical protein Q1695_011502 [Nippostrongylus brasiliensis]|nr:hypothetical protein Q1695_011502 [Nippostrongylus brasiliensis]